MLAVDAEQRISCDEALRHPFFAEHRSHLPTHELDAAPLLMRERRDSIERLGEASGVQELARLIRLEAEAVQLTPMIPHGNSTDNTTSTRPSGSMYRVSEL
mmetsp:Transcript_56271/g.125576  ORF Transcript_56271/g.125576 Transcript_56271/m.125576 type:complete len:101 (-) Transcript_56271:135-437(-)